MPQSVSSSVAAAGGGRQVERPRLIRLVQTIRSPRRGRARTSHLRPPAHRGCVERIDEFDEVVLPTRISKIPAGQPTERLRRLLEKRARLEGNQSACVVLAGGVSNLAFNLAEGVSQKKWVCRSWPTHTVPTPVHTGYARKGTPTAMNSGKLYAGVARRSAHAPATAASASCRDRRSVKIGSFSRGHAGVQRA